MDVVNDTNPLWELACQRWRCVCHCWCWICRPHREQARSYKVCWVGHGCCGRHKSTVGAGLPAMAVCQPLLMLDIPASSRASSLLHSVLSWLWMLWRHKSTVGAGLLAKAECQSPVMLDDRPHREQARSHSISGWPWVLWSTQIHCGSWPASDGG